MRHRCHVVIVAYRSADYVRSCVARLDPATCRSLTIVDNSDDPTELAALRSISTELPLRVIDAGGNIGFGAGVNRGVASLPQDDSPIWVLNPDTEPVPGAAAALLARLASEAADIVSPLLVTGADQETVWYAGGSVDHRTGRVRHFGHGRPRLDFEQPLEPVTFVCGAAPLFTRESWRRLGGFDESLFLYWEDVELSLRAVDLGLTMQVVDEAVVWHAVGGTSGEQGQSRAFYRGSARNRAIVMRRRIGLRALLTGSGLLTTLRLASHPFLHETEDRRAKFRAYVSGFLAGLLTRPSSDSVAP